MTNQNRKPGDHENDWIPTDKQQEALQSVCYETLYGGARGGGKTDAGLAVLLYDIDNPKLRQLVIRRNFDDLSDWIDRAEQFYARNNARHVSSQREFIFPSGSKIKYGHLADDSAYNKYQGHEYQRMLIEELTHIPSERLYMQLISSCRSTVAGLEPRIFATTNPGEIGHRWVRKRFIDVAEPGQIYQDPISGRSRVFIQAKVEDNPYLMKNDPDYVLFLDSLPDGIRQQWRDGSWEDVEIKGAYFLRMVKQAETEGRITAIPYEDTLPVHTLWDLGIGEQQSGAKSGDPMAVWLFQLVHGEVRLLQFYGGEDIGSLKDWFRFLRGTFYHGNWGTFIFPHDMRIRNLTDGESREDYANKIGAEMGFKVHVNQRAGSLQDKIDATKHEFGRFWFDRRNTVEGLDAVRFYHKEWDEKNQTFKPAPKHDWSSHATSALMEYALWDAKPKKLVKKSRPMQNVNRYAQYL